AVRRKSLMLILTSFRLRARIVARSLFLLELNELRLSRPTCLAFDRFLMRAPVRAGS
ncbi:MAG: hypothetical protein HW378_4424, partial [Anaerolineales bacterium]|nr:hypothetical protein [Anaerolineales bacterium]